MDGFTHMHMTRLAIARAVVATVILGMGVSTPGCSQLIDPNVPAPLRDLVEPVLGREYLLYRPSHYDREYDWPLIVVCHTSFPDSPNRPEFPDTILQPRQVYTQTTVHRFLVEP